MAKVKFERGSFIAPQQVKVAFSVVGLEARIAHTLGDFIRLVSASA